QAEDGIRDYKVTGVQTCALPIFTPNHHEALRLANLEEDSDGSLRTAAQMIRSRLACDAVLITRGDRGMMLLEGDRGPVFVETTRSEERRVGKEWRSRWCRGDVKK